MNHFGALSTKIEESESEQETPASKQDKRAVDIIVYESCMDDENENNNIQEKMDLSAEWNRLCENENLTVITFRR